MSLPAPLDRHRETVRSEWIDYNGHMNVAYYLMVFDHATDVFLDFVGLDAERRAATGGSVFTVDSHITFERELNEGDPLAVTTQLLAFDAKRLHIFHRMYHADHGTLAATSEWLNLYVDLATRRVGAMPSDLMDRLTEIQAAHAALGWPEQAGRVIQVPRKKTSA